MHTSNTAGRVMVDLWYHNYFPWHIRDYSPFRSLDEDLSAVFTEEVLCWWQLLLLLLLLQE